MHPLWGFTFFREITRLLTTPFRIRYSHFFVAPSLLLHLSLIYFRLNYYSKLNLFVCEVIEFSGRRGDSNLYSTLVLKLISVRKLGGREIELGISLSVHKCPVLNVILLHVSALWIVTVMVTMPYINGNWSLLQFPSMFFGELLLNINIQQHSRYNPKIEH